MNRVARFGLLLGALLAAGWGTTKTAEAHGFRYWPWATYYGPAYPTYYFAPYYSYGPFHYTSAYVYPAVYPSYPPTYAPYAVAPYYYVAPPSWSGYGRWYWVY